MNFFKNQEYARSQTKKLILLYTIAVLLTAFIIAFLVTLTYVHQTGPRTHFAVDLLFSNPIFIYTLAGLVVFIFTCSAYKIYLLSRGGKYIAEMVGAVPVDQLSHDPQVKKYINVVEEMALASGTQVPGAYIMENELSINAFAAGFEVDDAVVAVSRGALEHLSRDELQGVVAHEFSHILNGDMKLNIKLMGYLFGLSALVEIGNLLLRSGGRRTSSSRKKGSSTAGIGLILLVCGMVGMFFASLIKAAISRQREFLADASAVQFTRNPQGIGGALKKILGLESGSLISLPRAGEIGHLFFGQAVSNLFSFFSTHPPLVERIKAIDQRLLEDVEVPESQTSISNFTSADEVVGHLTSQSVAMAQQVLASIPSSVRDSCQKKENAQIFCYSLFLDSDKEKQKLQKKYFEDRPQLWQSMIEGKMQFKSLEGRDRLPMVDLLLPVLKNMTAEEQMNFLENCKHLIQADGKLIAQEFILYQLLWQSLNADHGFFDKNLSPSELKQDCACVLSFLLLLGKNSKADVIFANVTKDLYGEALFLMAATSKMPDEVALAFRRLRKAPIAFKRKFLMACQHLIESDKRITVLEYEFLRLVSSILLLPLPLLEVSLG